MTTGEPLTVTVLPGANGTYYAVGHVATSTTASPSGSGNDVMSLTYDTLGNPTAGTLSNVVTSGGGTTTTTLRSVAYAYPTNEAYGEPSSVTVSPGSSGPAPLTTQIVYDNWGRTTSVVDPIGRTTTALYNIADQTTSVVLPPKTSASTGNTHVDTAYLYPGGPPFTVSEYGEGDTSPFRQVVQSLGSEAELLGVSGSTQPVSYGYDAMYRTVSLTDGNSHTTQYNYTTAGYLGSTVYPNGDTFQSQTFDVDGNPTTTLDANGVQRTLVYSNQDDALTQVNYVNVSQSTIDLGYDTLGRVISKSDAAGSYTYSFDPNTGAFTNKTTTYLNAAGTANLPTWTQTYAYNADGTMANENLNGTSNLTFSCGYDGFGRMTGMADPFNNQFSYAFDGASRMYQKQAQSPSSGALQTISQATEAFNGLDQVTGLTNASRSGSVLSQFSNLNYDSAGNLLNLSSSLTNVTAYSGTKSFGYDGKDELTSASSSATTGFSQSFGYDNAGNPTNFKGATHSFNVANQDTANTYNGNGDPTTYVTYNASGAAQSMALTFDADDNATNFATGGTTVLTVGYTSEGLRAWKQNSTTTTYFLYDGITPTLELKTGAVTAVNTFGFDGLEARTTVNGTSSSSVFYTFDQQGGVAERLNASGNVVSAHTFDPYGVGNATDFSNGTVPLDPYCGFNGASAYYSDSETGLQLLGFRYYDTENGRFINRDPIGYAGGANLYRYVSNSPLYWTDPTGKSEFTKTLGHIGGHLWETIWTSPNTLIGIAGGIGGQYSYDSDHDVIVIRGGLLASVFAQFGQQAVTFGETVTWTGLKKLSREEECWLYEHELIHVDQYRALGPAFIPAYLVDSFGVALFSADNGDLNSDHMHDLNIFEYDADRASGHLNDNWTYRHYYLGMDE